MLLLCFLATTVGKAQINTANVVQLGRAAMYYDDYVTAMRYFSSAISAKPYLSDAYYYRAQAKFNLEDYQSAEEDLVKAVEFNPFRIEYYQLRGLCRIHNKSYQKAVDDYTKVLTELPEEQSCHFNRTLCRLELKDFEKADNELDFIIKRWPKLTRAYLLKAQTRLELKDTAGGLFWIDSLLVFSKREPSAWGFKARHALQHEDYALADSCFTQAIKYDAGNADYYLQRAQARHALNQYNLALNDYDRVIEMIPLHFVAHYNRAIIRTFVGDDNRAIQDFDFVIQQEPDNILAIYNRARLRQAVGDYRGAINDYTALLYAYPNFLYGYSERAKCYRSLGMVAQATKDETKVRSAEMDLFFGNAKRTKIKKVRKRSDRELEQYDQIVEEDADSARNYIDEFHGKVQNRKVERVFLPIFRPDGHQLVIDGGHRPVFCNDEHLLTVIASCTADGSAQVQESLERLKDEVAKSNNDAVIFYNLGCLEAEGGTLENAEEAFTKAIEADPLMAEAYYNKAVVYLLQNKNELAAPLLSKAGEMGIYKAYNLLKQSKKK